MPSYTTSCDSFFKKELPLNSETSSTIRARPHQYPNLRLNQISENLLCLAESARVTINWSSFIPAIGILVGGSLFAPGFFIGVVAGAKMCGFKILISIGWNYIVPLPAVPRSQYVTRLISNTFSATVVAPVIEELIFRGALQPLLLAMLVYLFPIAATTLVFTLPIAGTVLNAAQFISILATAVTFGAAHLGNSHQGSYRQAILCVLSGIVYGLLTLQFGLLISIAAHISNNTIVTAILCRSNDSTRLTMQVEHAENQDIDYIPTESEPARLG